MDEIIDDKSSKNYLILSVFIFLFQFLVLMFGSYRSATGHWDVNIYLTVFLFFPFYLISSSLGIFFAAKGLQKGDNFKIAFVCFMATSLFFISGIGPLILSQGLSPVFIPLASYNEKIAREKDSEDYLDKEKSDFDKLLKIFESPQKVIAVSSGGKILLENKIALELYSYDRYREKESGDNFENFAKQYLINQEVKIAMPNYEDFSISYVHGNRNSYFNEYYNRDVKFGLAPVFVDFKDNILNARFGSCYALQRYQDISLSNKSLVGIYEGINKIKSSIRITFYKGSSDEYNIFTKKILNIDNECSSIGNWKIISSTTEAGVDRVVYFLNPKGEKENQDEYLFKDDSIECISSECQPFITKGTIFKKIN